MERMFIRHLSGSKAGSTEQFALDRNTVLSIGRSLSCNVKYSGRRDPLVSRLHAKIECVVGAHRRFRISDAGSTNGTFVNSAPVRSSTELRPGDVVRLGARGPEFIFDLRPGPAAAAVDIRPGHTTVIRGMQTMVKGFFELEERRGAIGLFFRIVGSPVKETLRTALHGDRANPFKFLLISVVALGFVLHWTKIDYTLVPLLEVLLEHTPMLKELGESDKERVEEVAVVVVFAILAFVQYKILRKVSPERRRFRQFLVLAALPTGTLYFLLSIALTIAHFLPESGLFIVGATEIYWSVQCLRIGHRFWRLSYPTLIWYYGISAVAGYLTYFAIVIVVVSVTNFIAGALAHAV